MQFWWSHGNNIITDFLEVWLRHNQFLRWQIDQITQLWIRAGGVGEILMAPTPAPEQGFQNFSAPTPELAVFLLWLRLLLT